MPRIVNRSYICPFFLVPHIWEHFHKQYEDVVTHFDIAHKISHIVTDNPSNIIKAFNFDLSELTNREHNNDDDDDSESNEDDTINLHP